MSNKKKQYDISSAEWHVMEIVWEHKNVTAQQVIDTITQNTKWAAATVKTLINRLKEKGYLDFEVEGRAYRYYATISRDECVHAEADSFLKKLFKGNLTPMIAHFTEEHNLSSEAGNGRVPTEKVNGAMSIVSLSRFFFYGLDWNASR